MSEVWKYRETLHWAQLGFKGTLSKISLCMWPPVVLVSKLENLSLIAF